MSNELFLNPKGPQWWKNGASNRPRWLMKAERCLHRLYSSAASDYETNSLALVFSGVWKLEASSSTHMGHSSLTQTVDEGKRVLMCLKDGRLYWNLFQTFCLNPQNQYSVSHLSEVVFSLSTFLSSAFVHGCCPPWNGWHNLHCLYTILFIKAWEQSAAVPRVVQCCTVTDVRLKNSSRTRQIVCLNLLPGLIKCLGGNGLVS